MLRSGLLVLTKVKFHIHILGLDENRPGFKSGAVVKVQRGSSIFFLSIERCYCDRTMLDLC